ncbi:hypothetical protein CYLTODRAFT_427795 [Cylindrobasidium torrendii FP15055 ss-10]|uniref:Uncharacterized protein n=1 Tax=Cylindrobasidium torrendii FP15055 ss-10 TaxID=1314674 RepID=A0A0D7AS95_9AGAR|nr:hypothetical protein CYLTODRAFT_427795 [Cylindrobasidium torrendii FP15055 ss-10]
MTADSTLILLGGEMTAALSAKLQCLLANMSSSSSPAVLHKLAVLHGIPTRTSEETYNDLCQHSCNVMCRQDNADARPKEASGYGQCAGTYIT